MRDCIDRQAAIDAISCDITVTGRQNAELVAATIGTFADRIKLLPSAEPERKTGKWIVHYECPKCGEITKDFTEYCPFCNADMRGDGNE